MNWRKTFCPESHRFLSYRLIVIIVITVSIVYSSKVIFLIFIFLWFTTSSVFKYVYYMGYMHF